jgi:hypothetical protein
MSIIFVESRVPSPVQFHATPRLATSATDLVAFERHGLQSLTNTSQILLSLQQQMADILNTDDDETTGDKQCTLATIASAATNRWFEFTVDVCTCACTCTHLDVMHGVDRYATHDTATARWSRCQRAD